MCLTNHSLLQLYFFISKMGITFLVKSYYRWFDTYQDHHFLAGTFVLRYGPLREHNQSTVFKS